MIVINAVNLSSGGALSILKNVYKHAPLNSMFLIKDELVRKQLYQLRADGPKTHIVKSILQKPPGLFLYYWSWVNRFCIKNNATCLISLGNIASRTKISQKLYIHWPYFAYGLSYNKNSDVTTIAKRITRYIVIDFFSQYASTWVVQTNVMKKMLLKTSYKKKSHIEQIYPGFENTYQQTTSICQIEEPIKLFYPSLYYSHKNFELLYNFFSDLERSNIDNIKLTLTLPDNKFKELGFDMLGNVYNLGILPHHDIMFEYTKHHALVMPTFLETFGLPYLEAMSIGLPILSSKKEFAQELCGEYAIYFDPKSTESLRLAISSLKQRIQANYNYTSSSKIELEKFPNWQDSVAALFS